MSAAQLLHGCDTGPGRLTIRRAFERYYPQWSPDLSPRTFSRYQTDLLRWEHYMGDMAVSDVATEDFQQFRSMTAAAKVAPATCESTLRIVFQILRVCHAFRLIRVIPDRGKPRRMPQRMPRVLTHDELGRLYDACEGRRWPKAHVPAPLWWRCVLALGVWTGFRREDLLYRLSWEHVHLDVPEPKIVMVANKTGKQHAIPLKSCIAAHLRALREPLAHAVGSVFGTPRNNRDLLGVLRRLSIDAAVVPALQFKHLRSTGICLWRDADSHAGCVVHGTGLPRVMLHYVDQLRILEHAMEDVALPAAMERFRGADRQLRLW